MLKSIIDYLVKNLGVNSDVAVSVILTLFTFFFAYIISLIGSITVKKIKRRNYKKSLKIIINDFLKTCKKQYEEYEKFDEQKGYLFGEDYNIAVASSYSQNYLVNLDLNIFIENFSSLFRKNRASEISQLFESVEQVRATKEFLKENQKLTYEGYSKNLDIYNEHLDKLRKYHDLLVDRYAATTIESESTVLVKKIWEVFKTWKDNGGDTNVNSTLNQIINPLYDSAMRSRFQNKIASIVVENCLPCRMAVVNMKKSEDVLKSSIRESSDIHKRAYLTGSEVTKNW